MMNELCIDIENISLQQRKLENNIKEHITFSDNESNQDQIDQLLQAFEFGDCKQDINAQNMIADDQKQEQSIIDEFKRGKTIHTLIIDITKQFIIDEDLSRLSNFTKFCPNLVSLDIILDYNYSITYESIAELWTNIATHLNKLRQIKFDIKFTETESRSVLEIVKHASNLNNLLSISLNLDFSQLRVEDWKLIYSQFNKLNYLNTLILQHKYIQSNIKPNEMQVSNTQYKKLLRLVTKNTTNQSTTGNQLVQNSDSDDDDRYLGFSLF